MSNYVPAEVNDNNGRRSVLYEVKEMSRHVDTPRRDQVILTNSDAKREWVRYEEGQLTEYELTNIGWRKDKNGVMVRNPIVLTSEERAEIARMES